jgi:hypothetical protein
MIMRRSLSLLAIACVLLTSSNSTGRTISASSFLKENPNAHIATVGARTFTVDSQTIRNLLGEAGHFQLVDFPGGYGDLVTLDLKPTHSPIDASTQFIQGTTKGDIKILTPQFAAYRGKVLGEPNSRVILTSFGGKLLVSITRESGLTYVFGPQKNSFESNTHILMLESDLIADKGNPIQCFNEDLPAFNTEHMVGKADLPKVFAASDLLQTDIAVEADTCFYHAAGSNMTTVLGYIASLFAMSSVIYEDEAAITWHLTWVKVWTDTDPYNVKGNAYLLPNLVKDYWTHHYTDVPRDVAHVMTSIGYGGGGYGWFALCDTTYSYSVSSPQTGHQYPTFAFTYDAYIVAHEVGHNFSLPHSHDCAWNPPLDTCYTKDDAKLSLGDACYSSPITPRPNAGSIMSYCANANYTLAGNDFSKFKLAMTFTPRVDSALRVNAERAACIQPPTDPTVILLSPRGSESLPGDTTIKLTWASANVNNVGFEYTSDGGVTWKPIIASVPATDGHYLWAVPNVTTNKMRVRMFDAANASVADTSLLVFAVNKSASVENQSEILSEYKIAPSPARDLLIVTADDRTGSFQYDVIDIKGSMVLQGSASFYPKTGTQINVSTLPAGTYYLRLASTSPADSRVSVLRFTHIQ